MLLTKAVTDRQVILGNFLQLLILIIIALCFTLRATLSLVASFGNWISGETICGYLALILMSAAYTSIGLFSSSMTNNRL